MSKIRITFDDSANRWSARFDDRPQSALAELPVEAMRRLLQTSSTPSGRFEVHCDRDLIGSGVLIRVAIWHPPTLKYLCPTCEWLRPRNKGCPTCKGQGTLPT